MDVNKELSSLKLPSALGLAHTHYVSMNVKGFCSLFRLHVGKGGIAVTLLPMSNGWAFVSNYELLECRFPKSNDSQS